MKGNDLPFLPLTRPDIGGMEEAAVLEVLRSGWLSTGPVTREFEESFRTKVRTSFALGLNSCTAGLHLALAAADIGPGDEVITTPLTFCATVNSILQVGAMPVLADIGADLNISPDEIERRINHRTKAIIPVHLAGLPCEMSAIWSLAKAKNLMVIEDAAHAIGSEYRGVPIGGGASAAVVFSFYATKNLVSGEGGMVTTRCQDLDSRMRMLSLHGMSSSAWNRYHQSGSWSYTVEECGFKYNMSDIMASIGLQQLRRLDAMTDRRRQIAEIYNQAFANEPALEIPPTRDDSVHCWHLYILRLNLKLLTIDRDEFIEQMKALQIGCGVHFIPIPLHPLYRKGLGEMDCPRAIAEFPRLVSLPLGSRMTADEANRVVDAVKHIVGKGLKQTSPATLVLSGAGAP